MDLPPPELPGLLLVDVLDAAGGDGLVPAAAAALALGCRPLPVALAAGGETLPAPTIHAQFDLARTLGRPRAARLGRLGGAAALVAGVLRDRAAGPVVVGVEGREDLEALSGPLRELSALVIVRAASLPELFGIDPDGTPSLARAAAALRARGAGTALVGGAFHRGRVLDLIDEGGAVTVLDTGRIRAPRREGLSSAHAVAVAAHLARGAGAARAAEAAQRYLAHRLEAG